MGRERESAMGSSRGSGSKARVGAHVLGGGRGEERGARGGGSAGELPGGRSGAPSRAAPRGDGRHFAEMLLRSWRR